MQSMLIFVAFAAFAGVSTAFFAPAGSKIVRQARQARTSMLFDGLASMAVAAQLNSAPVQKLNFGSMPVAVKETVQGMYKEYTVDREDDSALDEIRSNYKTAEQTDENKGKYWAILAVLMAGSFAIPMVQYYWYVAEED
jgi:hypothetical protein